MLVELFHPHLKNFSILTELPHAYRKFYNYGSFPWIWNLSMLIESLNVYEVHQNLWNFCMFIVPSHCYGSFT